MVKLGSSRQASAGPSSTMGIMRFFDVDAKGPKITPEFVMGVALAFVIIVLVLRFMKF